MGSYLVRLYADTRVRLNQKPYYEEGAARSLAFDLSGVTAAIFDQFIDVGDVRVPRGLIVQVKLEASDINEAVAQAGGLASYLLSMLCCVTIASVKEPKPVWAYDASPEVEDREYRHFGYDSLGLELGSRRLDEASLFALLDRNFNSLLADAAVPRDYKDRVQRAIQSFRRALADNDDVLTEFIIAWSSMEGLDCVYRKLLPSAGTRTFMDGVRDVLGRLGRADVFGELKDLRDGLAHGSISLAGAIQTAKANLELVRRAFVLMILRVLRVEETVADQVLAQPGYKGSSTPFVKFLATIRFEPGDVKRLDGHPIVELRGAVAKVAGEGEKLTLRPTWQLTPRNVNSMTVWGHEVWGDTAGRPEFGPSDTELTHGDRQG